MQSYKLEETTYHAKATDIVSSVSTDDLKEKDLTTSPERRYGFRQRGLCP